jgi:hypothetical protein
MIPFNRIPRPPPSRGATVLIGGHTKIIEIRQHIYNSLRRAVTAGFSFSFYLGVKHLNTSLDNPITVWYTVHVERRSRVWPR